VNLGDAFLLKTGIEKHVWFVAHLEENLAILFNFTPHVSTYHDLTCVVTRKEYPTLHHESCVAYQHGKLLDGKQIALLEQHGILRFLDPVPTTLIKKIQQGAVAPKFTQHKINAILAPPPPSKSN